MKIAVIGNCQGESLAACLRAMNPSLIVDYCIITDLLYGIRDRDRLVNDSDIVFAQPSVITDLGEFPVDKLCLFPTIAYPAFHPDMVYMRGKRKGGDLETVASPMIVYHSALAVCCYVEGLTTDQTIGMFNSSVFSRFGYLDRAADARADLLAEGCVAGMPLGDLVARWSRSGNFMYTMNHPQLRVMQDLARNLLERLNIEIISQNPADYLTDPLRRLTVWPIYPPIAARFGLAGDYSFKPSDDVSPMTLTDFVERSFCLYDDYDRSSLDPVGFSVEDYRRKLAKPSRSTKSQAPLNPYAGAQAVQFWKKSVSNVDPAKLNPVVAPRLSVSKADKVATAGSCFAQHIARTLSQSGFNYYVPETAPDSMDEGAALAANYGVYSARYGNIYTVRQLVQLIERVEGRFWPRDDVWTLPDGRFVDPFRPHIEPEGFVDEVALKESRDIHFEAVRRMLREMDVFVFTLGLTEGWRSRLDGAVYPLAPGVAGGTPDLDIYEFHNFTVDEVSADLDKVLGWIKALNPQCRVILTVSPVPLIATYEPRHALVATTYSKSVLRTAAEHATRTWAHVEYFPSYEIITGSFNRGAYYEDDLREVTPAGVAHVMAVFMENYTSQDAENFSPPIKATGSARTKSLFSLVCDEEAILNF